MKLRIKLVDVWINLKSNPKSRVKKDISIFFFFFKWNSGESEFVLVSYDRVRHVSFKHFI